MTENRQRTEVVSLRLTPEERERLEQQAGDEPLSTYLRRRTLNPAPSPGTNPHMKLWNGITWRVEAAPGRVISIRRQPGYVADGVGVWTAADTRRLAAALLAAADIAEQPEPDEEVPA